MKQTDQKDTLEDPLMASERARAEAEAARAEADAANRAKSDFLATMSHEFRTPLNAVLGYSQLLEMGVLGPLTPAQHEHLQRLQSSAGHLLHLVDDVLDVAKADAAQLQVRADVLMTGVARAAAIALVQPQATAKGVRIVDLQEGTPGVTYLGDEHRVRQILVNLLSNAVKFTAPGGTVTIDCGIEPAPLHEQPDASPLTARAFIAVTDTGRGIGTGMLGRIFEPFVQGPDSGPRGKGGTGLGLAISRRLARLMNGDITVESSERAGSRFTLWLPAPGREHANAPVPGTQAAGSTSLPSRPARPPTLDARSFSLLESIGARLAMESEPVTNRFVAALRADSLFPGSSHLPSAQLRDHVTPVIGLVADQMMTIGETQGQATDLLRDGGYVQKVMAELHGAQRLRLGWSEADMQRESELLTRIVLQALENAIDYDVVKVNAEGTTVEREVYVRATGYAVELARHIFVQSVRTAIHAHRQTKVLTEE